MADIPSFECLLWFATGLLGGSMAPTYYANERLRGFGRALFAKLPYQKPPTAEDEQEAMEEAVEEDQ